MKKLLYTAGSIVFILSACKTHINDGNKQTIYMASNDSTVIVYIHNANTPIILKKPINVQDVQKYNLPYNIISSVGEKTTGMRRYINGDENDIDGIAWLSTIVIFMVIVILFFAFLSIVGYY
jgi:hypothetical protein